MTASKPEYRFEPDGSFAIDHYNLAPPFSSFLPGIAGALGIPMWVFYVNRSQGVCSFGLRDKDHSIVEYLPANWAYQLVFRQGFRTFLKLRRGDALTRHEPFQMPAAMDPGCLQTMRIWPHQVSFRQHHPGAGIETDVLYYTAPGEPLAVLVRSIRLKNIGDQPVSVQMLDGLPLVVPHGIDNYLLKNMRYIAQSHIEVTGLAERTPGFRTKASTDDSALVEETKGVNFCFGYEQGKPNELLMPIVDPFAVFGAGTDIGYPDLFLKSDEYRAPARQMTENQFPSALLLSRFDLAPGKARTFHTFFGYAPNHEQLSAFVQRARGDDYVERKRLENTRLIESLTQACATVSSHEVFNAYARQNLLDNLMRGGAPTTLARTPEPVVLSLFTRKHGDLERDYNYFTIEPTFYSQGESNYRDVNQNRRHDVFMNPDVGSDEVVFFMNLIQADGFNPLLVRPKKFLCKDGDRLEAFAIMAVGKDAAPALLAYITKEFELGRLFQFMAEKNIALQMSREEFVRELLPFVESIEDSAHGMGYWSDHWVYNMDLLDSFRGIYPERFADLLFRRKDFIYCDSHVFVRPRSEKYVLCKGQPMQLDSIFADPAKEALIKERKTRPYAVRTRHGKGPVYFSLLAPKLLGLAAVKLASLDTHGIGIEMESDRPNWYDALNGLPGQFGSSTCETFELKRLLRLLQEALTLAPPKFKWALPVEIADLVRGLNDLLARKSSGPARKSAWTFWDKACTLKEAYRERIRMGFAGEEQTLTADEVESFVARALAKVEDGLSRAFDKSTGLYHTYFRHEPTDVTRGPKIGKYTTIRPTGFKQIPLPAFLEGQVHALRLEKDTKTARELVRAVSQSGLFDQSLHMYKVNASLMEEPRSIGRARTFARGWLENESIWLHMEYKYLLEMLRAGLHQEFFEDFRRCAIPFLKPETYGRSPTENSSFLVSEVYPDKSMQGKGFMARLSGATAEFIHLWLVMCAGERPFRINGGGRLEARLSPALPAWLFTTKPAEIELLRDGDKAATEKIPAGSFAFMFLGQCLVTYTQSGAVRDTFGPNAAKIQTMKLVYNDGKAVPVYGDVLKEPHAGALRRREIRAIHATLG